MTRTTPISRSLAAIVVLLGVCQAAPPVLAKDVKTDKGNQVINRDAQIRAGKQVMVKEDGKTDFAISGVTIPSAATVAAVADKDKTRGASVKIVGPATPFYDCHGYTFKSGALWIDNNQVQKILDDQGWKPAAKAKVDDIVVYKLGGEIKHTGIVKAVDGAGKPTVIRSKWGARSLADHAPADVPPGYGTAEVFTGGSPLKDPESPISQDLETFYEAHPVSLKDNLTQSDSNDFPVPTFTMDSHSGCLWTYSLDTPVDLSVTTSDSFTFYAAGIEGGTAASGWLLDGFTSNSITFSPLQDMTLSGTTFGFDIMDCFQTTGDIFVNETLAGSDQRTLGPTVPEPSPFASLGLGALGLLALAIRPRRARLA